MKKRQQLALETKHKIIVAARQLIEEKGINNISVQDITDKAGVAKGSFYTYYAKKEDVLGEIAYQNFDALKEKYLICTEENRVLGYLSSFVEVISEGGLELCKSWTSNEIFGKNGNVCKFEFDCANLKEILTAENIERAEEKSKEIMVLLYGIMTAWCMTDGRYDFIGNFRKSYSTIKAIIDK